MSYQVILKRCANEQIAANVTQEVASMSGAAPEQIMSAVTSKSISIGKDFSEEKALELKARFESLGAEVSIKDLSVVATSEPVTSKVAGASAAVTDKKKASPAASKPKNDEDDDEDEDDGRLLTEAEYVKALNQRMDIFVAEKDRRLRFIMPIVTVAGLAVGIFLTKVSLMTIAPDFYNKLQEKTVSLSEEIDLTKNLEEKKEEKKEEFKEEKKKLKETPVGSGGKTGGGGDPKAMVTKKGVLGIISGAVTGQSAANSDIFGKGGYASGIDAVLSGVGGLQKGGGGGTGRKGEAGIGFGSGYGSGFGGSSGGVDDLLGSLMGGGGGSKVEMKKRGELKMKDPSGADGAGLTGGRSRANIMRVVQQNMASLKYAYNRRLADNPDLKGKITVKWAIDEFGKVLFCKVISSTINDPDLEAIIVQKISLWAFGQIDKPGDVTEVVYPFVFTQ